MRFVPRRLSQAPYKATKLDVAKRVPTAEFCCLSLHRSKISKDL